MVGRPDPAPPVSGTLLQAPRDRPQIDLLQSAVITRRPAISTRSELGETLESRADNFDTMVCIGHNPPKKSPDSKTLLIRGSDIDPPWPGRQVTPSDRISAAAAALSPSRRHSSGFIILR